MSRGKKRGIRIQNRIILSAVLAVLQVVYLIAFLYDYTVHSSGALMLSWVAGIIMTVYILNCRRNPDHKLAWIIFILTFPIFGISVYLLWGGGRVMPHLRKKMKRCEEHYLPCLEKGKSVHEGLKYYDILHSRQADYLVGESGYPLYKGTDSEYLYPGERFQARLLQELKKAQKYIYIEFFILAEGYMWNEIHEILKQKASDGVEIKIIFDDFGSIKRQSKGFITSLKEEGIEVAVFNPINPILNMFMNNRDHRKIVVIDGKVAFTGGVNIGDEYIGRLIRFGKWMDSAVLIRGEAVKSFLVMFCCLWEFSTGKQIDINSHICECSSEAEGYMIPYCDDPLNKMNPAEGIYLQMLNSAQRYVYIMTPYLIIDNAMITTLKMAVKSGVDVRIVTPHIPDKKYVHPVTQYNYLELLEAGVRIYEYTPGFMHSKVFLSDDKVATVGSVNMDYRSFVFHFECGLWMCNSNSVLDIREHFYKVFEQSQEIDLEKWKKRPLLLRLKQAVLHIFAPFM